MNCVSLNFGYFCSGSPKIQTPHLVTRWREKKKKLTMAPSSDQTAVLQSSFTAAFLNMRVTLHVRGHI